MPLPRKHRQPSEREPVELAALADGSLTGRRRERLEARVAASPALRAALEQQIRAVEAIRSVDVRAPAALRDRVAAAAAAAGGGRSGARWPARRLAAGGERGGAPWPLRRFAAGAGLAVAVAAAALVVALTLPDGAAGPSVVEAAALSGRPATAPAPQPAGAKLLEARAAGLPFPDWAEKFGWEATGERRDELDGREAVTVFYEKEGRTIGYTILSGEPLDAPDPAATATREGTRLAYVRTGARTIVTWKRAGRTCVLSGAGVPVTKLLDLAGWRGLGEVPF